LYFQLRLDFTTFVINGPTTFSISYAKETLGSVGGAANGGKEVSALTNCLTDTFSVTGGTVAPPVICGTNTNAHSNFKLI